ncbi:MAG: hypothetical protein LWX51_04300 [Deltaproteobacteria bacterium]|jgi:type I site-specific restriction-modification system R (restriction) subunit|nr:hypothetical protein [Deltaproteobacteria bacterium]
MAQTPDEKTYVELPFIEQLKGMGWDHIEGDIDVPYLTERESFRDVLLADRLRKAVKRINLDDNGNPWLDDDRVNQVVSALERISAPKLMEANKKAFDLIVQGVEVEGDPALHGGKEKTVAIIDFDHPETDKSVTSRFIYGKTQTSPRPLTAAADILKPFQCRNGDRTRGHTGSTRWSRCTGSDHQKEI